MNLIVTCILIVIARLEAVLTISKDPISSVSVVAVQKLLCISRLFCTALWYSADLYQVKVTTIKIEFHDQHTICEG